MCDARLKVFGYARISTRGKRQDGLSLGVQADVVRRFCEAQEMDLVDVVEDGGRSGESLKRPGIRQVFRRIDAGEAGGIVVAKLDRLTRSVRDWAMLVEERFGREDGARFFSAHMHLDLLTPEGRFQGALFAALAQQELEQGVIRSAVVMTSKRDKGQQVGGIPFGKQLGDDGDTLVDNARELEAISYMRRLRDQGCTFRQIALGLDDQQMRPRSGSFWSHSSVAKILTRHDAHLGEKQDGLESTSVFDSGRHGSETHRFAEPASAAEASTSVGDSGASHRAGLSDASAEASG